MITNSDGNQNIGSITRIRGSVIDVEFHHLLPEIDTKLVLEKEPNDDDPLHVVLEVVAHLDDQTVRCIALNPTRGMSRGRRIWIPENP